tara:strand:+ start:4485 stop:6041 length:1557 start_codon:yes stop_codon:yes gene_type:complete
LDYSNIKKIYIVFISFWIINFLLSNYQIIPNSDDAFYIIPAIGFSQTNEISFIQFNEKYTFFERFPFYTFVQGIFYKLISFKFDINFYNYRLLNILIFTLILIFSFKIIEKFNIKDLKKIILFPIFIALTPISQTYILARPEILGILFILIAIYFFINKLNYKFGSLFLGLASISHPSFIFFNIIFFFKILLKKKLNLIISCFLINLIPIIILIIYYYLNEPESISQLNLQAKGLPYFKALTGLFNYSFGFLINEFSIINLINSFYYLPSIIILIIIYFQIKKERFFKNNLKNKNIVILLFISSLILLIVERNHPYLISISSFFLTFVLFLLPWKTFLLLKTNKFLKKKNLNILIIASFLFISSWNLIHLLKFKYYKESYLNNSNILNLKNQILNDKKMILVTRPELVPYFNKEIYKNYKNGNYPIYWLFPDNGRAKNYKEREKSEKLIKELINNNEKNRIVWLIAKKNFSNNCLTIDDALNYSESIKINLNNLNVLYETNKYLIFNAKHIEYSNSVC